MFWPLWFRVSAIGTGNLAACLNKASLAEEVERAVRMSVIRGSSPEVQLVLPLLQAHLFTFCKGIKDIEQFVQQTQLRPNVSRTKSTKGTTRKSMPQRVTHQVEPLLKHHRSVLGDRDNRSSQYRWYLECKGRGQTKTGSDVTWGLASVWKIPSKGI